MLMELIKVLQKIYIRYNVDVDLHLEEVNGVVEERGVYNQI